MSFNLSNLFSGGNQNQFMELMFKPAPDVVWDLSTGRIGVKTAKGIAVLEGEGEDATVDINMLTQFGMSIPAFAQSTPVSEVKAGDLIYFGATDRPGWVIEKKENDKGTMFKLLKTDGQRSDWRPPKVTMLGMSSGVMVLRTLLNMLGGSSGLQGFQTSLMPLLLMSGGNLEGSESQEMLSMLLMGQMMAGNTAAGGAAPNQNPMMQMLPMLMMAKALKGGGFGKVFDDEPISKGAPQRFR